VLEERQVRRQIEKPDIAEKFAGLRRVVIHLKVHKKVATFVLLAAFTGLAACGSALPPSSSTNSRIDAGSSVSEDAGIGSDQSADSNSDSQATPSEAVNVILGGFSAKAFQAGDIPDDDIQTILQCGAKAPSARNLQPWHFTVIRDGKTAKSLIRDCPDSGIVIVISGSSEQGNGMDVSFDCGLATQNMYIAAQSLGLGAHIYLSGVQEVNNNMRETLGIPNGYDARMLLLIGQMKDDVDAVTSASKRNPLDDIVNYVG